MMERIGIIVAMDKEFDLLKPKLLNLSEGIRKGYRYATGEMNGIPVILQKCGIGKVNAAIGAVHLIQEYEPTVVLSTGVAGALLEYEKPLDVVVARGCAYHDVYCGRELEKGQVQGMPPIFETDKCLADIAVSTLEGGWAGLIVSGDVFVDSDSVRRRILHDFPEALAVDMESCAIAHVCHKASVPFLALRVISDNCEGDGYDDFWTNLAQKSFEATSNIIKRITEIHFS